jgi:hypothetical protein
MKIHALNLFADRRDTRVRRELDQHRQGARCMMVASGSTASTRTPWAQSDEFKEGEASPRRLRSVARRNSLRRS